MKRYWSIVGGMLGFFLATFFIVEALHIPILSDPSGWLGHGGWVAAVIGVGLLIADVLLPVPSSLVMVAHGALFGTFTGTLLSLSGSVGATLFGFWIGRRGGPLLERLIPPNERARANLMIDRWGALAVVATRPMPLLAETTAILAGASDLSFRSVFSAGLVGSIPPSLLYALAGSIAATFQNTALMFAVVMSVTGIFWVVNRRVMKSGNRSSSPAAPDDTE